MFKKVIVNDVRYLYDADLFIAICIGFVHGSERSVLAIPASINNCVVTEIHKSAFSGCTELESVLLPDTLTHIQSDAFRSCRNLKKVCREGLNVVKAVSIREQAFYNCKKLETVELLRIEDIWTAAFEGCYSLTSFEIPNCCKEIKERAFANCFNLKKFKIKANKKAEIDTIKICDSAFLYTNITDLHIGCNLNVFGKMTNLFTMDVTIYSYNDCNINELAYEGYNVILY